MMIIVDVFQKMISTKEIYLYYSVTFIASSYNHVMLPPGPPCSGSATRRWPAPPYLLQVARRDWRGSAAENKKFPTNANLKLGKIYYYADMK